MQKSTGNMITHDTFLLREINRQMFYNIFTNTFVEKIRKQCRIIIKI